MAQKFTKFTQAEVKNLFSKANRVYSQNGLIILQSPAQKEYGRMLIIAPKRVGSAPERNKLRRQLKSIFITNDLLNKAKDWIFILRPQVKSLSFEQLQKAVLSTL